MKFKISCPNCKKKIDGVMLCSFSKCTREVITLKRIGFNYVPLCEIHASGEVIK